MFLIITCIIFHMPWWVWAIGVLQMLINSFAWLLVFSTTIEMQKTQKSIHVTLMRTHGICQGLLAWAEEVTIDDVEKPETPGEDIKSESEEPKNVETDNTTNPA